MELDQRYHVSCRCLLLSIYRILIIIITIATNEYVGEQKKKQQPIPPPRKQQQEQDNMASTASRGQIKRKPLNKLLMDQVSNQMAAIAKETQQQQSLEHLLKTFEVPPSSSSSSSSSPPPIATVSDEAKFRRQPSEYKPDTGSIPTRRSCTTTATTATTGRLLEEITPTNQPTTLQDHFTVAPPKSPRPPAQQIEQTDVYNYQQYPVASPNIMHQQIDHQYHQQQQQQQQQYMGQPQRSPMIQPQRSPMMQPQRSPMMQPQRSPMMQPTIVQQQHHYGSGLPPPITIPVTNYGVTPQPSPSLSYSNLVLSPSSPYQQQQRPTQYSDGRPILCWGKYQ
jgi:hypothetical protein